MLKIKLFVIVLLLLLYTVVIYGKITCLDNSGKPIDWLVVSFCQVYCFVIMHLL